MIALKRILVPTDFSENSEIALTYARALAEPFGASLHVLHVIEDPFLYGWTGVGYMPDLPEYRRALEKNVTERLMGMFSVADRERFKAELVARFGHPFVEIIRYAKAQDIDLIVLGTHGRGAVAHLLMGSVAEKVVRKAPCPVLTVRHPEHEFVMP
jgi:nucleotide-binding universal stress UspA family protein